ncbi:MAG: hypothetical protein AAF549_07705 [Pseudomonadota bacterium]
MNAMTDAKVFEDAKAPINDAYHSANFSKVVDYLRDNPELRSGKENLTIRLEANRSFSGRDETETPVMSIDIYATRNENGVEEVASLSITISGKNEFKIAAEGFGGEMDLEFKQMRAVNTRFSEWMKNIEAATDISDIESQIRQKAGVSTMSGTRTPGRQRHEGQRAASP